MIRARFKTKTDYSRPISRPIKHPYWISGYGGGCTILVAYADNLEELLLNWPEAASLDIEEVSDYDFSSRFPKPTWFN